MCGGYRKPSARLGVMERVVTAKVEVASRGHCAV